jgi:hypothetical protein
MTTTYALKLASADVGHDHRLYVTIEGISNVFQDDDVDVPTALVAATYTRCKCLTSVAVDERSLDALKRRQIGGGITIRLVEDDSGTLRTLFSPRRRRVAYVSAAHTSADVTINMSTNSALPSAGNIYVGGETIAYTALGVNTITGCTRGAFGSRAAALFGSSENGQAIYTQPPSWVGRKVTLGGYFLNDDGSAPTSAAMGAVLGTFEIASPPQYVGNGIWEIACVDRIDGILSRGLYVAMQSIESFSSPIVNLSSTGASANAGGLQGSIYVMDSEVYKVSSPTVPSAGDYSYLLLEHTKEKGWWQIVRIDSFGSSSGTYNAVINVRDDDLCTKQPPKDENGRRPPYTFKSARLVSFLKGESDRVLFKLLTSIYGDASNGADDVLRGAKRVDYDGVDWRLGAGIPRSDLDTTAFSSIGNSSEWWWFLHEPTTAEEVLREWCLTNDAYIFTKPDGTLSAKSLADVSASVLTIDDGMIVGDVKVSYDEQNVFPHVILKATYNRASEKFEGAIEVHDAELAERYPNRDETLTIESKSTRLIYTGTFGTQLICAPCVNVTSLQRRLRRFQIEEGARAAGIVSFRGTLACARLNIGDVVTLTCSEAPNLEGGTLSSQRCRVVSVKPIYDDGLVELRVQMLAKPRLISPAGLITNVAGNVVTLSTTSPEAPVDGNPGFCFGPNVNVKLWDISANTFVRYTVTAVTGSTVTLSGAPAGVALNEDILTLDDFAAVTDLDVTNHGYTPNTDFIRMLADATELSGDNESRWR